MSESTPEEKRFRLARTVTIGDIGVVCSFIGAAFMLYSSLDKRVERVEYSQQVQESRTKESILDLKVDIKEMQGTLNSVQREIARIPNQNQNPTFIQIPQSRARKATGE